MKNRLNYILLCMLAVTLIVSTQVNLSASHPSASLPTETFTPTASCDVLPSITPPRFGGYDAYDGSVFFNIRNQGTEIAYLTGFELVWPDPTHPEVGEAAGRYHLRRVVLGSSASDPSGSTLWTSIGSGQDATGNTKIQIPYDIATDSTNPLEGVWQVNGILNPGDNLIWLDFDGFEGSLRQFNVLRHQFDSTRYSVRVGQPCDDVTPTPTPDYNHTETNIPTYGPSPTSSMTFTPNALTQSPTHTPSQTSTPLPTLTLTPSPSSPTPTLTRTWTNTPGMIDTETNIPTDGPSYTPTLTITPSPSPSSTLTFTPSITLDPCGFLPTRTPIGGLTPTGGAGGDSSVGLRTTPCPATYTPTFTPSLTDLPSLTPQPTLTNVWRQPVQLLVNPNLDNPLPTPIGWEIKHKPDNRRDDKLRRDGDFGVFMFKGGPSEKSKLKQLIWAAPLPIQTGDYLSFTMAYRKSGPIPRIRVKVEVVYRDGTPKSTEIIDVAAFANRYRSVSYPIALQSLTVDSVNVSIIHKSPNKKSKVFIDSLELWWIPAP